MSKKEKQSKFNFNYLLYGFTFLVILSLLLLGTVWIFLISRFYPEINIAGTPVDFLTIQEGNEKVSQAIDLKKTRVLSFSYLPPNATDPTQVQKFQISLIGIDTASEIKNKTTQAFEYGHNKAYFKSVNLNLSPSLDSSTASQIESIAKNINQYPIDASLKIEGEEIVVSQSQEGLLLDETQLEESLINYLNTGTINPILPLKKTPPKLSYTQALAIKKRLDQIKISPLVLKAKDQTFTLDLPRVLSLIDLNNSQSVLMGVHLDNLNFDITSLSLGDTEITDNKITLNKEKLGEYLR